MVLATFALLVACGDAVEDDELFEGEAQGGAGPVPCGGPCPSDHPVCCDRWGDDKGEMCHLSAENCICTPGQGDCPGTRYPTCCDTGDGKGFVCRMITADCL